MKPEVSIILPAIRKEKWIKHYNSIFSSTKKSFELIIVSPYSLPQELEDLTNIKFIKDFGSPVRAQQIAANFVEGKYVTWSADDGLFVENAIDNVLDILQDSSDYKTVVTCKYAEAGNQISDKELKLNFAYPNCKNIDPSWLIFNAAIMHTKFFNELGGYNCCYETTAFSHADLAARAQHNGANVIVYNQDILKCEHMPDTTGDHAPIHYAHTLHDQPLYTQKYNSDDIFSKSVMLDNWKEAPSIWSRRFNF